RGWMRRSCSWWPHSTRTRCWPECGAGWPACHLPGKDDRRSCLTPECSNRPPRPARPPPTDLSVRPATVQRQTLERIPLGQRRPHLRSSRATRASVSPYRGVWLWEELGPRFRGDERREIFDSKVAKRALEVASETQSSRYLSRRDGRPMLS